MDLRRLDIPKVAKTEKHTVTNEEARKLLAVGDCARDKVIACLPYKHGLAPADVAEVKVGKYPTEPWVYFELAREKTGEKIRLVSTPDGCDLVKAYMVIRRGKPGEPLFMGRKGPLQDGGDIFHVTRVKPPI